MIQEYLFSDKSKKDEVKKYAPVSDVTIEITDIENSDCWTISYSLSNNDEPAAKKLSEIDEYIVKAFQPTVLANESAAYFNKSLYPLANDFERKLRKLLYLKSVLNPGEKAYENIRDLESKDLGKIFELLFTDPDFVNTARKMIKEDKSWQFTKAELHSAIDKINEDTLWEHLIGKGTVPTLLENFMFVREYRNDIMHAHNIRYKDYKATQKLFKEINEQLDIEIGKIIAVANKPSSQPVSTDYNAVLNTALTNMNHLSALAKLMQEITELQANLSPSFFELRKLASNFPKIQYSTDYEKLSKLSETLKREMDYPYHSKPDETAKGEKDSDEQTKETK